MEDMIHHMNWSGPNTPEATKPHKTEALSLSSPELERGPRKRVSIILVSVAIITTIALFFVSLSYFRVVETEEAQSRLTLYKRSLNDTLERFQYLPFVLARDPAVINQARSNTGSGSDSLSIRLSEFANIAELEAIYFMDVTGEVLASSNYKAVKSFVGQNYGFRPYFQSALRGKRGEFFGLGATTGRPGYFVSEPVYKDEKLTGVIAIKLDMSELQDVWEQGGENVLVSNENGVTILSSQANWLYQTLSNLSADELQLIISNQQFGNQDLAPLNWQLSGTQAARLDDQNYIYASEPIERLSWTVHYLLSETRLYERAITATTVFGGVLAILLVFATFMRSVRIRTALDISQSDRAQLITTNTELQSAQEELSRSSKLAALGQLSASVTHELGQPISALRNHLAAAEIGGEITSMSTLGKLNKVIDRMENITKQLRFFTKPAFTGDTETWQDTALQDVVKGAMDLVEHDLISAKIKVDMDLCSDRLIVKGHRHRLEQVLVNLMTNSIAAMSDEDNKKLEITVRKDQDLAQIIVRDTGAGFGNRDVNKLQEPFHTTRASGDGMGLGLSITAAIIKEHNGILEANNIAATGNVQSGAEFIVSLPICIS